MSWPKGKPAHNRATAETFWARVDQSGGPDACWGWTGQCSHEKYGSVSFAGTIYSAHRIAAYLSGMVATKAQPSRKGSGHVLHECDNPRCCNPKHFKIGTYSQNNLDAYTRERHPRGRGSTNPNAKLTVDQVRSLRAERRQGQTFASLGRKYGINEVTAREAAIGSTHVDVV